MCLIASTNLEHIDKLYLTGLINWPNTKSAHNYKIITYIHYTTPPLKQVNEYLVIYHSQLPSKLAERICWQNLFLTYLPLIILENGPPQWKKEVPIYLWLINKDEWHFVGRRMAFGENLHVTVKGVVNQAQRECQIVLSDISIVSNYMN